MIMADIGRQGASEVYATPIQVWQTLLNWLTFICEIFVQMVRGTVPSFINYSNSTKTSFRPLPVVETSHDEKTFGLGSVCITSDVAADSTYDHGLKKLTEVSDSQVRTSLGKHLGGGHGKGSETVVLDLDETLVCAYETSSLPDSVRKQATDVGLTWFELECVSSDRESDGKPKISYVTVFERPGLHEFLAQLSKFADLVLFTAGLEGYARPLVDRIDAENRFSRRLYRPSTISTEYREHVKDLSFVSTDFCRMVIVDNNPFSFLLQPVNGIPCIPFSAGQPRDDQV
ncbi:CTD nuclear envelope phosphatase 1 [Tanacetum coccineum]|uniref:CTD nuclear envelope phosphatase 1 n=1 Tax=Tanacetum coccineum TaxID=301880 RepID=A0ABQ4ZRZ7_9ASTR